MEFFVENWLWFLIAAIIILMTLIGYIAEKTDFGRKDIPKKEKVKKEKKKIEKEPIEVLEVKDAKPEVQMSLATDSILDNDDSNEQVEEVPEDLKAPFGDVTFEEPVESLTDMPKSESTVDEVISEEPTEELSLDDVNTPNIELPDLETIVTEVEDDDDDVWKF